MTIANLMPINSAIASQMLKSQSGANHNQAAQSSQQSQSTQTSPLNSLLNALSSTSSTTATTLSSLMNSLPGFSASSSGPTTNIFA